VRLLEETLRYLLTYNPTTQINLGYILQINARAQGLSLFHWLRLDPLEPSLAPSPQVILRVSWTQLHCA